MFSGTLDLLLIEAYPGRSFLTTAPELAKSDPPR